MALPVWDYWRGVTHCIKHISLPAGPLRLTFGLVLYSRPRPIPSWLIERRNTLQLNTLAEGVFITPIGRHLGPYEGTSSQNIILYLPPQYTSTDSTLSQYPSPVHSMLYTYCWYDDMTCINFMWIYGILWRTLNYLCLKSWFMVVCICLDKTRQVKKNHGRKNWHPPQERKPPQTMIFGPVI